MSSGGVVDHFEDAHAAAALAAEGDVERKDSGEEFGPTDTAGSRRGRGRVVVAIPSAGEAEGELLPEGRDGGRRNDASAEMVAIREHTEVPSHVKTWWRHEGTQAGDELVGAHVGMGCAAVPRGLEVDAQASAPGESLEPSGPRLGASAGPSK